MRLLLVEDDLLLGRGIVDAFHRQGDSMDWLQNGRLGLEALRTIPFDLVILDLGLPELSGLEVLSQARRLGIETPVLILTARDQVEDRVKGLDAGADDYLIKPFDLDELNARLRALLRRRAGSGSPKLELHGVTIDPATREVTFDGQPVVLARREYALLVEFFQNPGRILTREHLVERLYSWDERVESNAIEVHVHHLRKKFGSALIKTVRGVGYRIEKST